MSSLPLILALLFTPPVFQEPPPKKLTTHQVPYRLTDTMHVLVRAKINGKGPFNFIIDTGAPTLFVATEVGKELGISADKNGWATFDKFEIEGGAVLPKTKGRVETPFQLEGMNGMGLAGATLHGIIGYTVLAKYKMEFDFTRDKLAWTELEFEPPAPVGLSGKGGSMGGLDALGGIMKFLGTLMGTKAEPVVKFRGFAGIELGDVDGSVDVITVLNGGPAEKAGLKAGDRLTHVQGKSVSSSAGVTRLMQQLSAGQKLRVALTRDGKKHEFQIELGDGI
jgi:hypothetical protein